MFQIVRSCKLECCVLSRCYGSRSKQRTHYDTLRIPQTSSQKEIREAFIKLSKEMHPDIKGKNSHDEFVEIKEAYNILSKENLRSQYDMNIKYGNYSDNDKYDSHSDYSSYSFTYGTRSPFTHYYYYKFGPHFADGGFWNSDFNAEARNEFYKDQARKQNFWIAVACCVIVVISFSMQFFFNKSIFGNKELVMAKIAHYQRDFKKAQDEVRDKSIKEQIEHFKLKVSMTNSEQDSEDKRN